MGTDNEAAVTISDPVRSRFPQTAQAAEHCGRAAADRRGGAIKKPTRWMSNSPEVLQMLLLLVIFTFTLSREIVDMIIAK